MVVLQIVVILVCSWEEVSSGSFYSPILASFDNYFSKLIKSEKESTEYKGKIHNFDYIKINFFSSKSEKASLKNVGEIICNKYNWWRVSISKRFLTDTLNRINSFIEKWGTPLVVQWLRIHLPMQRSRVWFLLGELRSHMPRVRGN